MIDVWHLDESGFAPTLPTGYTWARTGTRALVWDEPPQGRRVNVIGALAVGRPTAELVWASPADKLDSGAFLSFVWREVAGLPEAPVRLPPGYHRSRPGVIVLDNYAVHRSAAVKAALVDFERVGVHFFYLPPYSPELNRIERLWRHVKHEEMPIRSYQTLDALQTAVADALNRHVRSVPAPPVSTTNLPEAA